MEEEKQERKVAESKERFVKIISNIFIEGVAKDGADLKTDAEWVDVVAAGIKLSKSSSANPKYLKGNVDLNKVQAELARLNPQGDLPSGKDADELLRLTYSDALYLCVALKPRPGMPATVEDSNFDADRVQQLFDAASFEAREESLESLGRLVDMIVEQGVDELASSPAKLRLVVMALAHPHLADPSGEPWTVLKQLLGLVKQLHAVTTARDTLVRWWAALPLPVLLNHVSQLQTFLTVSLLMAQNEHGPPPSGGPQALQAIAEIAKNGDLARHIRNALRLLDCYWRANEIRRDHGNDWRTRRKAQLAVERGLTFDEESIQVLCVSQFHNDAVNECEALLKHDLRETLEMQSGNRCNFSSIEDDQRKDFGLIEFPFILTAVSKVRMLSIESLLMQREEVRTAMVSQLLRGRLSTNPFLVLKVKRHNIIGDTLQQLANYGSLHFKKPLKIVFDGEEGVDEGGVQKEFFQLLTAELYNEDFGMFESSDESNNLWFNKNSFEANLQFELFGIVLGLAIYNQVILDVKFPKALYKKLMNDDIELGLSDLLDFQPRLAKSLIALLEFDSSCGSRFEDVFPALRFVVEYECFGSIVEAELKEGGKDIEVNFENREDYIQRYCDWIFCKGVSQQYKAFRKGFDQCIGDTLFRQLFRPDELELVICGSMELDFDALEKVAQYQDGYTVDSPIVRWFWQVVHSLSPDDKKLFLQFCTGCDRAPVGGLGRLPFVVSRAGPDSSILPTVHTCFNHILVPEYESKEKLERLIRLAIQHSTGFGLM